MFRPAICPRRITMSNVIAWAKVKADLERRSLVSPTADQKTGDEQGPLYSSLKPWLRRSRLKYPATVLIIKNLTTTPSRIPRTRTRRSLIIARERREGRNKAAQHVIFRSSPDPAVASLAAMFLAIVPKEETRDHRACKADCASIRIQSTRLVFQPHPICKDMIKPDTSPGRTFETIPRFGTTLGRCRFPSISLAVWPRFTIAFGSSSLSEPARLAARDVRVPDPCSPITQLE